MILQPSVKTDDDLFNVFVLRFFLLMMLCNQLPDITCDWKDLKTDRLPGIC